MLTRLGWDSSYLKGTMFSRVIWRRLRLVSGRILLLFVAGHLCNLALGLVSVDAMERWRNVLLMPWQTPLGQALLLTAAIVHAGLGLVSLASRHSLAMRRTDWVQLLLGLATDRKSTRLNSSHVEISYAVFCLKKKKKKHNHHFSSKKKKIHYREVT